MGSLQLGKTCAGTLRDIKGKYWQILLLFWNPPNPHAWSITRLPISAPPLLQNLMKHLETWRGNELFGNDVKEGRVKPGE